MNIWEMTNTSNKYFSLILKEQSKESFEFLKDKFKGESIQDEWKPLEVEIYKKSKKFSDSPIFWDAIGSFILSNKAYNDLKMFLEQKTEVLPLIHPQYSYYIVNNLNVIDCLDKEKTVFTTLSNGKIVDVENYVFRPEVLENQHIFKIKELKSTSTYVSDKFKEEVEKNNLKGFLFQKVWSK